MSNKIINYNENIRFVLYDSGELEIVENVKDGMNNYHLDLGNRWDDPIKRLAQMIKKSPNDLAEKLKKLL